MIFYIKELMNEYRGLLMLLQNTSYKLCFSWIYFLLSCLLIRHLFGCVWFLAHPSKTHLLCCCRHGSSLVIWFSSAEYDMRVVNSAGRVVKPAEGDLKKEFITVLGQHEEFYFLRIHMICQTKYFHLLGY